MNARVGVWFYTRRRRRDGRGVLWFSRTSTTAAALVSARGIRDARVRCVWIEAPDRPAARPELMRHFRENDGLSLVPRNDLGRGNRR